MIFTRDAKNVNLYQKSISANMDLIQDTIEILSELSNAKHAEFSAKMIPTQKKLFGVKTPELRKIIKHIKTETCSLPIRSQIELAISFVQTNIFEMGQIGYELIGKNKQLITHIQKDDLHSLNYRLDNWASVDTFGVYVYGKAWRLNIIDNEELLRKTHHEDFWQRRLAVVSTVALNQKSNGGEGDVHRTLIICKEVVEDYQDLVVKALSWALRELSKREPLAVLEFVERYENILHRRVLREVNNKLTTGHKNPQ